MEARQILPQLASLNEACLPLRLAGLYLPSPVDKVIGFKLDLAIEYWVEGQPACSVGAGEGCGQDFEKLYKYGITTTI